MPPCWAEMMFSEPVPAAQLSLHLSSLPLCPSCGHHGSSRLQMLCLVGAGYQIDWTVGGRILGEKNDTFPWVSDSLSSGLPSLRSPWTCYVREFVTPTHVPTRLPTLPPTTHPPFPSRVHPSTHSSRRGGSFQHSLITIMNNRFPWPTCFCFFHVYSE